MVGDRDANPHYRGQTRGIRAKEKGKIVKFKIKKRKLSFFMPMRDVPTATHQQKKTHIKKGRVFYFDPTNVDEAKSTFMYHLARHVPKEMFDGPLECTVKWLFPITGKREHGDWRETAPDCHNLNKLLFDIMTKMKFWKDDARVASEHIEKFFSEQPGVFISIKTLPKNSITGWVGALKDAIFGT